jgi:hypothetical protein
MFVFPFVGPCISHDASPEGSLLHVLTAEDENVYVSVVIMLDTGKLYAKQ